VGDLHRVRVPRVVGSQPKPPGDPAAPHAARLRVSRTPLRGLPRRWSPRTRRSIRRWSPADKARGAWPACCWGSASSRTMRRGSNHGADHSQRDRRPHGDEDQPHDPRSRAAAGRRPRRQPWRYGERVLTRSRENRHARDFLSRIMRVIGTVRKGHKYGRGKATDDFDMTPRSTSVRDTVWWRNL
jgi:hypothetical protein